MFPRMSELCFGMFKHCKSDFRMVFHHLFHPHGVRGSLNFDPGPEMDGIPPIQKTIENVEKNDFFTFRLFVRICFL